MSYTLINFNIPDRNKTILDQIARLKRSSRTAILNRLIETFVREESKLLAQDGQIADMLSPLNPPIVRTNKKKQSSRWEDSY